MLEETVPLELEALADVTEHPKPPSLEGARTGRVEEMEVVGLVAAAVEESFAVEDTKGLLDKEEEELLTPEEEDSKDVLLTELLAAELVDVPLVLLMPLFSGGISRRHRL